MYCVRMLYKVVFSLQILFQFHFCQTGLTAKKLSWSIMVWDLMEHILLPELSLYVHWHSFSLIFSCFVLTRIKIKMYNPGLRDRVVAPNSVCKGRDEFRASIKDKLRREGGKTREGTVSFTFPFLIFQFTLTQCHLCYSLQLHVVPWTSHNSRTSCCNLLSFRYFS